MEWTSVRVFSGFCRGSEVGPRGSSGSRGSLCRREGGGRRPGNRPQQVRASGAVGVRRRRPLLGSAARGGSMPRSHRRLLGRAWWDRREGVPGSAKEETTGLGGDDRAGGRGSNAGTASRVCAGPARPALRGRARKDGPTDFGPEPGVPVK